MRNLPTYSCNVPINNTYFFTLFALPIERKLHHSSSFLKNPCFVFFIVQLEEEIRRLKEGQKRTTQMELRFQRERETWKRERNDLQRRLTDSLSTRRMENNRIEGILEEVKYVTSDF